MTNGLRTIEASPQNKPSTCAANRARHEAALNKELARYEANGFRVTRNVSFRDPAAGGLRVVADAVISPPGIGPLGPPPLLVIDVKTGGGGLTPNQSVVYPKFNGPHTLIPVGLRAFQAGFIPGIPYDLQNLSLEVPRYDADGNRC